KEIGKGVYAKSCASCHGAELEGIGAAFPSLVNLNKKYNEQQVRLILDNGRNMMPSFKQMPESEKAPLITFLLDLEDKEAMPANTDVSQNPSRDIIPAFSMTGYHRFM